MGPRLARLRRLCARHVSGTELYDCRFVSRFNVRLPACGRGISSCVTACGPHLTHAWGQLGRASLDLAAAPIHQWRDACSAGCGHVTIKV